MAEAIPGAAFVELPGDDHLPWVGDSDRVLSEIEAFLTGVRGNVAADRVLGTVLFTDIVGSTERAAEIGDLGWRDLLEAHNARVRREFERFDGREAKTTGDGFLATFDGPARAVRCANAITQTVRDIGIEVTRARSSSWTARCTGSPCTSALGWPRWPVPVRSSSPRP